ncbi:DoxX family protein [Spirosoma montaniterrae]|uniref:DoxX family protein n=1 Tax=Spirosoma montaniterrae TaxID=1178516 RepID=A0A1P9X1I5_9BACT|nr:DoxX family protein [Spirosoma montaniterrae]AQG81506.1 hypothetical protein AWR27_20625 [Spirosoma montaniterrae]
MEALANHGLNQTRPGRALHVTYRTVFILFSLSMVMDGVAGVLREQNGQEAMRLLGYPIYVLVIVGTAKLLGVITLWQTRYRLLREWAYAGFTINFVGAFASWLAVEPSLGTLVPPVVMLIVLFTIYTLEKRGRQANA